MPDWSPKHHLLRGLLILAIGLGGFVAWALLFDIRGAVVAGGEVAVEARRQAIQHRDGGLVAALHVKEGQTVTAGTPILTLDGTEIEAERTVALRLSGISSHPETPIAEDHFPVRGLYSAL